MSHTKTYIIFQAINDKTLLLHITERMIFATSTAKALCNTVYRINNKRFFIGNVEAITDRDFTKEEIEFPYNDLCEKCYNEFISLTREDNTG